MDRDFTDEGNRRFRYIIGLGIAVELILWAVLTLMVFSDEARAHMADSGWTYGTDCCSINDCKPVAAPARVVGIRGGWLLPWGEILPYNDHRVRKSGDSDFHICDYKPINAKTPTLRCLYVPPFEG